MDKIKQQRVIITTKELLTGNELIEVIKEYKLENHLILKIEKRGIFEEEREIDYMTKIIPPNAKKIDDEYIYIFIDKECNNG